MRFIKEDKPNLKDVFEFDKFMENILDEEISRKKDIEKKQSQEESDLRKVLDKRTERPSSRIVWRR